MPMPGMSVPGASDLGLGFDGETEEERRKRILAQQQNRLLPSLTAGASNLGLFAGYGAAGSPAGMSGGGLR